VSFPRFSCGVTLTKPVKSVSFASFASFLSLQYKKKLEQKQPVINMTFTCLAGKKAAKSP
jgi:hypothetical protein